VCEKENVCPPIRQILRLRGSALMFKRIHVWVHTCTHTHVLQMIVFKNSSQGAPVGDLPAGHSPDSGA